MPLNPLHNMTLTQTGNDASASIDTYNDVARDQHNITIGNMANGQIEADDAVGNGNSFNFYHYTLSWS